MTAQNFDILQKQTEASADGDKARTKMTKSAGIVAIFTALSRVTGLLRDMVTSHLFGASAVTDAFVVAFTIPNAMRRLVAEGALTVAFIPVYTDVRRREGDEASRDFFRATLGLLTVFLVVLVILGVLGSSYLVYGFASGFEDNPAKYALTTSLTQMMFPYVFFISLIGLCMGALNSRGHFTVTAASPILLNVGMIAGAYFCRDLFAEPVMGMALGVLVGGFLQLCIHIPALKHFDLLCWPTLNYRLPAVMRLGRLLLPAIFGVAAYQLNLIVLRQIGSYLPEGQLFYYYNADRLMQLSLGIFATSIATAALPTMSGQSARGEIKQLLETWSFSTSLTNFVTIPAAIGLLAISLPIASILWLHGQYNWNDVQFTAYTTMAFAPGLIAIAMMRTTVQVFYALEDMRSPVIISATCIILNLVFGILLLPYEVVGLALAFTLSSFAQMAILLFWLRKKVGPMGARGLMRTSIVQLLSSAAACLVAWTIARAGSWDQGVTTMNLAILMASICSAILIYGGLAVYFGSREAEKIGSMLRIRIRRK